MGKFVQPAGALQRNPQVQFLPSPFLPLPPQKTTSLLRGTQSQRTVRYDRESSGHLELRHGLAGQPASGHLGLHYHRQPSPTRHLVYFKPGGCSSINTRWAAHTGTRWKDVSRKLSGVDARGRCDRRSDIFCPIYAQGHSNDGHNWRSLNARHLGCLAVLVSAFGRPYFKSFERKDLCVTSGNIKTDLK